MENADALVLRTVDFSESSRIVTLYTRQFGKIEALAKGCRRLKSSFESSLDILAQNRVTFIQKRGDTLDLLTESKLVRRFRVTKSNLAGLFGGYYFAELVHDFTERNDPNPAIYDLTIKGLNRLEEGTFVMRSLIRFEGRFLRLIGSQPSLRNCVECGQTIEVKNRVMFALLDGGVLCPACAGEHQQVIPVTANALEGLERLTDPQDRSEHWKRLPIGRNTLNEIRGLMNQYISHLLGRKPRMYDWLGLIGQNDRE
jgi:DNA repair protein RecO (recombination protein O)